MFAAHTEANGLDDDRDRANTVEQTDPSDNDINP